MEPSSMLKTAVTTRWGLFEYTRLPQGVRNAPAHFMRVINKVLQDFDLMSSNAAFIDDLTSHGSDFQSACAALQCMLSALREVRLCISPLKMKWGYTSLSLLGHLISSGELRCQPDKLTAIASLAAPTNVSELRSFLGVAGYYRAFISHFATLATPLFALLKKDTEYVWSAACEQSFQALKSALMVDPVLHVANKTGHFLLYTDWSCEAVSAILH